MSYPNLINKSVPDLPKLSQKYRYNQSDKKFSSDDNDIIEAVNNISSKLQNYNYS